MIKLFLSGIAVLSVSTFALAQGVNLFPELQGQFQKQNTGLSVETVQKEDAPKKLTVEMEEVTLDEDKKENKIPNQVAEKDKEQVTVSADPFAQQNQQEKEEERGEGNIEIKLTNLDGVLPYARDYSYCFGDLVLRNNTNQKLESLSIELTYRDTPTTVSFSGVAKKKTQKQALMLIGKACEDILSPPEVEITVCKMPPQSEEACKKRVQFIPPNG